VIDRLRSANQRAAQTRDGGGLWIAISWMLPHVWQLRYVAAISDVDETTLAG
jgi:hypothetical protein